MSQITAVEGVSGTKNNSGVAINVGNSTVLASRALGAKGVVTGSVVVDGTDTNKAVSAGVFAYNNQRPVAKRLTTTLATVSNSMLLSGALIPSQIRSINSINSVVTNKFTTAVRAGYFNIYNGKFVDTNANVFNVTNSGTGNYVINGEVNPTLTLSVGQTYTFNIIAVGHPFWIKTTQTTGTGDAYNAGVTNNGTANGTITFVVPSNAPNPLYYNCQSHSSMKGIINIVSSSTGGAYTVPSVTDTFPIDNAAGVSRSSPGTLTFRTGSKLPVSAEYSQKTT